MREDFVQYLWQYQYFDKNNLRTTEGKPITIIHTGYRNHDAGPDFVEAKIVMDNLEWTGSIEIHVKSSDWFTHNHHLDNTYNNVILHVAWEHNQEVFNQNNLPVATLELKNIAYKNLLCKYKNFIEHTDTVPCSSALSSVTPIIKLNMIEKALVERLQIKAQKVLQMYKQNNQHWEQTAYNMLAYALGLKINADALLQLSNVAPYYIIQKLRYAPIITEALLFGQAGLLSENYNDEYPKLLQKEYEYLCRKYSLQHYQMNATQWKFLRTRPANFPTIRIAQLNAVLTNTQNIFSLFTETILHEDILPHLYHFTTEYWHSHYMFDKLSVTTLPKAMGKFTAYSVLVNAIIPVLAAYSIYTANHTYMQRALDWLSSLPPERNNIVQKWENLNEKMSSAFDSQGYLALYNQYCSQSQCLRCDIGISLLKKNNA